MGPSGRPVFGAIAGFVFFFFIGLTLMVFGAIPFAGPWLVLPLIGIVVGALWGWWAPFNRRKSAPPLTLVPGVPIPGQVPTASAPAWTVRPVTGEVPVTPAVTGAQPPTSAYPAEAYPPATYPPAIEVPPEASPGVTTGQLPAVDPYTPPSPPPDPLHWAADNGANEADPKEPPPGS